MSAKLKAVLTIIGGFIALVGGMLLRRCTKRGRISGVASDIHEVGESVGRTSDAVSDAQLELENSRRIAGEIAVGNADNHSDVERAKEILRSAKARSNQVRRNRKPD